MLTFFLAFYLATLAFFVVSILAFWLPMASYLTFYPSILSGIYSDLLFWHSIWHLFWPILAFYLALYRRSFSGILSGTLSEILFWHSILHSIWNPILAFYLACWDLALAVEVRQLRYLELAIECPAVPTEIWSWRLRSGSGALELTVELRQCALRSCARSRGPAVPTESVEGRQRQLRSGARSWGWQWSLRSSARGWGPAVPTEVSGSSGSPSDLELAVEVRKCALRSGAGGWGPDLELWSSRLSCVSAHLDPALAVEVQQCPLRALRAGSANWDLELAVEAGSGRWD